jgi:acetyltransferase-like isoleucine patch superfamily enzyme
VGQPLADGSSPKTTIGAHSHIRAGTIIYAGNTIGQSFQTGNKANIREYNSIGDRVSVGTHTVIEHHVTIEDGVRIHSQAFVPEYSILKKGSWVGPNVVLTNAKYPLHPDAKNNLVGPTLEPGARVGANATVLPGVVIGECALVGAGSVVTRDVAAGATVVGNPASPLPETKESNK